MHCTNQQTQLHDGTRTHRLVSHRNWFERLKSNMPKFGPAEIYHKVPVCIAKKVVVKHNGYCRVFVYWLAELRGQCTLSCTPLYMCVLATLMCFCSVFDFLFQLAGCWRRICLWLFDMHIYVWYTVKEVSFWQLHLWQCLAVIVMVHNMPSHINVLLYCFSFVVVVS